MLARIGLAFVDIQFASLAAVAFGTVANELADAILATAAIHARIRFALVDVAQAARVKVAARAIAFETVDQIRAFT